MLLTARTWSHTRNGISAIYVKGNIPDGVFDRLMNWAVTNIDSLYWQKNNPRENLQGLNPYGSSIESWNKLWKELQSEFECESEEGLAIAKFHTIISDNPEILIWVRNLYRSEN